MRPARSANKIRSGDQCQHSAIRNLIFSTAMGPRRKLTAISSLGCVLFCYDTGIISDNQLYMRDDLGHCSAESSAILP